MAPQVILRPGGSMSDIYVNHELKRDLNGNIEIDPSTGNLSIAETDFRKVGQFSPRYTMGWSNTSATRASNSARSSRPESAA